MLNRFTSALTWLGVGFLAGCASLPLPLPGPAETQPPTEVQADLVVPGVPDQPEVSERTANRYAEAIQAIRGRNLDEAERLLAGLTKGEPDLAGPWLNLGHVYALKGQLEAAQVALNKAVQANPQNCPARTQLGVLLRKAGDFAEARSHYEACLAYQPDFAPAHLNLGILNELYIGDLPAALASYQRYLELQPEPEKRIQGWVLDLQRRIDS